MGWACGAVANFVILIHGYDVNVLWSFEKGVFSNSARQGLFSLNALNVLILRGLRLFLFFSSTKSSLLADRLRRLRDGETGVCPRPQEHSRWERPHGRPAQPAVAGPEPRRGQPRAARPPTEACGASGRRWEVSGRPAAVFPGAQERGWAGGAPRTQREYPWGGAQGDGSGGSGERKSAQVGTGERG